VLLAMMTALCAAGASRSSCRATIPLVSPSSWLLVAAIFLIPPASAIGAWIWARRMSRRPEVPDFVSRVAYALVILSAVMILFGLVYGSLVGIDAITSDGSEQKARALAEWISAAMHSGALGVIFAVVAALWLLFCTWRWRNA
jgi:hypothetical protein